MIPPDQLRNRAGTSWIWGLHPNPSPLEGSSIGPWLVRVPLPQKSHHNTIALSHPEPVVWRPESGDQE